MKKKNIFLIPTGKSPTIWNSTTKVPNDRQSSSNQLAKDHTRQDISSTDDLTRDNYNDENTSIFLNATTGIFFPSCHLHLPNLNNTDQNQIQAQTIIDFRIQKITTWQRKFYQVQVYIINTVIMIILTIIFCLVTVSKSFNYNSNILDPFWFNITILLTMLSGIISVLFAWELNSGRANQAVKQENSSLIENSTLEIDPISSRHLCIKCCTTFFLLFFIFIPLFVALAVFLQTKKDEPYVFLISQDGQEVNLSILAALTSLSRIETNPGTIYGHIENDCYVKASSNFTDRIIVINGSSPKCKIFMEEDDLFKKVEDANASAIILLDDTPKSKWRVSSPFQIKPFHYKYVESTIIQLVLNSSKSSKKLLPFLMIRRDDWVKHERFFRSSGKGLFISWDSVNSIDLSKEFTCAKSNVIRIEEKDENKKKSNTCMYGKFLLGSGLISERICINSDCSKFGGKCPKSFEFPQRKFSLNIPCQIPDHTSLSVQARGQPLSPVSLPSQPLDVPADYCCLNTNSTESSYVEVLGGGCFDKWRDVGRYHKSCSFSPWIKGVCEKEMMRVYRLCLVTDMVCVIREYFLKMCTLDIRLPLCSSSKNVC